MKTPRYGVILGCPRSGTSFLGNALRAIPNTECWFGNHLPVTVPHLVHLVEPKVAEALACGFRHSLDNHLSAVTNSRLAALGRWYHDEAPLTDVWAAFQRRREVELLIYKEPFLAFAPAFAFRALPESRIIHIVRDGRDCAHSLVRTYDVLTDARLEASATAEAALGRRHDQRFVPWWVEPGREAEFLGGTPFVRAVWMWKEMVARSHAFGTNPDVAASGRFLLVRYEDLVKDPVAMAGRIVTFLGKKMDTRIARHFSRAHLDSLSLHLKRDAVELRAAERIAVTELKLFGYL